MVSGASTNAKARTEVKSGVSQGIQHQYQPFFDTRQKTVIIARTELFIIYDQTCHTCRQGVVLGTLIHCPQYDMYNCIEFETRGSILVSEIRHAWLISTVQL